MKNKFLFSVILILAITTVTIYSCQKEPIGKEVVLEVNAFESVGSLHNEALDFIFDDDIAYELSKIRRSKTTIDTIALVELILEKTNEFLIEKGSITIGDNTYDLSPITDLDLARDFSFSTEPSIYYSDCSGDPEEILVCINDIMDTYQNDTENPDYIEIMSTGWLYKYSIEYWIDNESNFMEQFGVSTSTKWFNWGTFAFQDLLGAASGAKWGFAGGPATAFGAALAGGIISSAVNAAGQAIWHEL